MDQNTLCEFTESEGPWCDGELMVVRRQYDRIDGKCLVTGNGDTQTQQCSISKISLREGILPRAWFVFAVFAMVLHRLIAPMLIGRELSLSESNFIILPGLLTLVAVFDHAQLAYPVCQAGLRPQPFKINLPPNLYFKIYVGIALLPFTIVMWNLDTAWMTRPIRESILLGAILFYAYLLLLYFQNSGDDRGSIRIVRFSKELMWVSGVSPNVLQTMFRFPRNLTLEQT